MSQRTYLKNQLHPCLKVDSITSLFYSDLNPKFNSHGEKHDFWEFVYIDTGKLSIQTDAEDFVLEKGEIYFHSPQEFHLHQAIPKTATSICIIAFSSESTVLETLTRRRFQLPDPCRHALSQSMKYGSMIFSSLVDTKETLYLVKNKEYPSYAEQMLLNYLEIFLMEMVALTDSPHPANLSVPSGKTVQNPNKPLVDAASGYLSNNLFSKVTIADLCEHLGCSKTTLSVAFKAYTGMTVIQYLNCLKIEKAKELIRMKSLNLTQISEILNFCNISYFSNSFRQYTGMHPSDYVKSIKVSDCIRYLHSERGQEI